MRLIDHAGEFSVSIHETADFIEDKPELAELESTQLSTPTNNLGDFTTIFKQEKPPKTLLVDDSFVIV